MLYFRTSGGGLQFQINVGAIPSYVVPSNDYYGFNYNIT
jgi:hypothetical protein